MAEARPLRGLIDTSVVIDLPAIDPGQLPVEVAISAVTLAELAAGPHATTDAAERAKRQDRLQRVEATFEPMPVDASVARAGACPVLTRLRRRTIRRYARLPDTATIAYPAATCQLEVVRSV